MGAVSVLEVNAGAGAMNNGFPRPLNQGERELLVHLLNKFFPTQKNFLEQLDQTVVVGGCLCGCPTIHLWKAGEEVPPGGASRVFWLGNGENLAGELVGLLLFEKDGVLSCLEIFPYGDERACGLPKLELIVACPTVLSAARSQSASRTAFIA